MVELEITFNHLRDLGVNVERDFKEQFADLDTPSSWAVKLAITGYMSDLSALELSYRLGHVDLQEAKERCQELFSDYMKIISDKSKLKIEKYERTQEYIVQGREYKRNMLIGVGLVIFWMVMCLFSLYSK